MKKKLLAVIFFVIAISLLAGCGKKPASEATLKEDLYNSRSFSRFSNQLGMKITDLEVVKRQTTEEQKSDVVWVEVNTSSEAAEGEMYYVMRYELYNDGWQLENITEDRPGEWQFTPLKNVDAESAPQDLLECHIQSLVENLSETDCQIESFNIDERQTYVKYVEYGEDAFLADILYVSATAVDNVSGIRIDGKYTMTYTLRNDEWNVDNICATQEDITPTKGVDAEIILAYVKDKTDFDKLIYVSTEPLLKEKAEYHYVKGITYHPYMTESCTYKIPCSFTLHDYEWKINDMQLLSTEADWDAAGSWCGNGETSYYRIFTEIQTEYSISAVVYRSDENTLSVDYEVSGIQGKNEEGTVYFDLTNPVIDGRQGNVVYLYTLGDVSCLISDWLWGSAGGNASFVFHEDLGLYLHMSNGGEDYFLNREN